MGTTHKQEGLLSEVVAEQTEYFRQTYAHWIALYRDVNRFACELRYKIKLGGKKTGVRDVFAVCVYGRLLEAYQSVLILAEKGAGDEAKNVLRSVLECLFILGATFRRKRFAEKYILYCPITTPRFR